MFQGGYLGVDVGSVFVSAVLLDGSGQPQQWFHHPHQGNAREALREFVERIGPVPLLATGLTAGSPSFLDGAKSVDAQCALIAGARVLFPDTRSILFVGGEKFGLIRLRPDGGYRGTKANSSCAAGTGSFLDQQARRLGFADVSELSRRASACSTDAPRISTRCAVFARTDLAHAQQQGYSLEEISDGLCRGLAQNIADAILGGGSPEPPIVFAGGVSLNQAVRRHLENLLETPLTTHELSPVLAAYGVAVELRSAQADPSSQPRPATFLPETQAKREYFFAPLDPGPTVAASRQCWSYQDARFSRVHPVEVEQYQDLGSGGKAEAPLGITETRPGIAEAYLGIDVGSTSTKAILVDGERRPIAGFYARTQGSPLTAVQAIAEAIEAWRTRAGLDLGVRGVATTGAGRKLIGTVIRADLVVDEITAHARAAYELDPEVDTIIEIGGQDAKFTTLRDGMVTFSHMNTVCAAGTGSFLEEQAARLGCKLSDYEARVRGAPAPLSSDRCAVFMERDINNFIARGYRSEEILAAALYSVRENYLRKVARGAAIGNRISFQGATARNAALVEAFRQGLGKPIRVSPYCHLAGALGAALLLAPGSRSTTTFVGLDSLREPIPVRTETCDLCRNHCRILVATVGTEEAAYGFLCGKDYHDSHRVESNRSGFDLLKERVKAFEAAAAGPARASGPAGAGPASAPGPAPAASAVRAGPAPAAASATPAGTVPAARPAAGPTIGIPAALGLFGQLPVWKSFFRQLGVSVITSEGLSGSVESGRLSQGAEFCAPVAALHGHVRYLSKLADWIFLPYQLEEAWPGRRNARAYCYYTQYAPSLVSARDGLRARCLMPRISLSRRRESSLRELHDALHAAGYDRLGMQDVRQAFETAIAGHDSALQILRQRFAVELARSDGPSVVLLGRPYNVLSPEMNKGIPRIFGALGVRTFYQDMVPYGPQDVQRIEPLLRDVHWVHAARILEAACVVADTPGLYPVYLTSFLCSPDSMTLEYFKRILDERGKPYLILQLDDHDSTLGYETRVEAGVASFRNHFGRGVPLPGRGLSVGTPRLRGRIPRLLRGRPEPERAEQERAEQARIEQARTAQTRTEGGLPVIPRTSGKLGGQTLLLPVWDPLVNPLLAANLRREGIDARLLEEDSLVIRKAMRHNTGQCLPLNVIVQEAIDYVRGHELDPSRTALWIPHSVLSCNFGMFPSFMKSAFEAEGMAGLQVYPGDMYYQDISIRATLNAYRGFLAGGLLRRVGCRLRPYEKVRGATDQAIQHALQSLLPAFEGKRPRSEAFREAASWFDWVAFDGGHRRPKVAVFGDIYVRDNDVMNQGLIHAIEEAGGEVVTTPYTEYVRIVAGAYFQKLVESGDRLKSWEYQALWAFVDSVGKSCRVPFARFLDVEPPVDARAGEGMISAFALRTEHAGESFDNLLKIAHLAKGYPDLALFVQASPSFCCPSLVTEAMARDIEQRTGVPVVSITYDGTGQYRNDALVPFLRYAGRAGRSFP